MASFMLLQHYASSLLLHGLETSNFASLVPCDRVPI